MSCVPQALLVSPRFTLTGVHPLTRKRFTSFLQGVRGWVQATSAAARALAAHTDVLLTVLCRPWATKSALRWGVVSTKTRYARTVSAVRGYPVELYSDWPTTPIVTSDLWTTTVVIKETGLKSGGFFLLDRPCSTPLFFTTGQRQREASNSIPRAPTPQLPVAHAPAPSPRRRLRLRRPTPQVQMSPQSISDSADFFHGPRDLH